MDNAVFTDPVRIGPGIWFMMHTLAVRAITDELKRSFVIYVNSLCDNFRCKKCQPHFRKFIDTHPFQNYWYTFDQAGRDIGFFKWTWELHNQVNKFLKKYEPTLQEAYEYFSDSEIGACFDCGSTSNSSGVSFSSDISGNKGENITRAIPPILQLYQNKSIPVKPFN